MLKLHHLNNSRSMRILWLLEELGVDYELVASSRDAETLLGPESQREVHPQGTWPVIEHDGHVLAESGAIVEYLLEAFDAAAWRCRPGDEEWPQYLYWLHYAEATLQPLPVMSLIFRELPKRTPSLVRPVAKKICDGAEEGFVRPRIFKQLSMIDAHLGGREWFVGNRPTGADVMMSFPLETSFARFDGRNAFPNITGFLGRVHGRPAYRRAMEKGGPYDYGPVAD